MGWRWFWKSKELNMTNKSEMLALLQDEFDRWEALLGSLTQSQITAPHFIGSWSIQDVLAHLMAWQTRSIARLEAAQLDQAPDFPHWPVQPLPDPLDNSNEINAWIYATYRDQPWPDIHRAWVAGYQHFLQLAQSIPEKNLLDPQRYPWMEGQPLLAVLQSSYDHHHLEHLAPLLSVLHQHNLPPTP
jgi:hypothetical protein